VRAFARPVSNGEPSLGSWEYMSHSWSTWSCVAPLKKMSLKYALNSSSVVINSWLTSEKSVHSSFMSPIMKGISALQVL
jgi:hypothetical protein